MCYNIAESFNSWILDERKMPTYQMIDNIRVKLMEMSSNRQREAERWTSPICPTMDDEMMKMVEVGRHWQRGPQVTHVIMSKIISQQISISLLIHIPSFLYLILKMMNNL
ncbi:hypothetical protein D8674_023182 [Pyrus ussuriensis x Pyrus communis]|uniref:Uncharacterized protein n=1 Tax=Pyrus ussuriensis x Pyrus communis TaxID=2448454 RepID=A0A5N5H0N0_9ROSA|nr:hypothetical protein D8674_023182 [Pyrus ussuriensis x Pyrus communis]